MNVIILAGPSLTSIAVLVLYFLFIVVGAFFDLEMLETGEIG